MSDGHSRVNQKDFGEQQTPHFKLRMTFNEEASGRRVFVIHASSSSILNMGGFHPLMFLDHIGFHHHGANCPFYRDRCMYLETWQIRASDVGGFPRETEYAHDDFKRLVANIEDMYQNMKNVTEKLTKHMEIFPWAGRYQENRPTPTLDLSGEEPGWLDKFKVEDHKISESGLKELQDKIGRFSRISSVLWATGEELEDAVYSLLSDIGFSVQKCEKGFTVDLIAEHKDIGTFALEVTGLNDAIKKKTNKINQAISFIQDHQDNERVVILANTFNDLPPDERLNKEQFTTDALKIMTGLEIVGMTCVDLYDMWKAIRFNEKSVSEIFKDVFDHKGGLYSYKA